MTPDGAVAVTGVDVGELRPDGGVGQVVGCLGDLWPVGTPPQA